MRWLIGLLLILCTVLLPGVARADYTQAQIESGDTLADLAFEATDAGDFATAESYWTRLIERFPENPAIWSNRGNARVSQNRLEAAIGDYNESVRLAPEATDPYLNRGTALEGLGRFEAAIADYNRVLELDPSDAMAYNNRGNAKAGLGEYAAAIADYHEAAQLSPNFAFARASEALMQYEVGNDKEALRQLRAIIRKYPMFADVRASLTAVLWQQGKLGEAESNWVSAIGIDSRYRDLNWVRDVRRWPPRATAALESFLNLQR